LRCESALAKGRGLLLVRFGGRLNAVGGGDRLLGKGRQESDCVAHERQGSLTAAFKKKERMVQGEGWRGQEKKLFIRC